MTDERDEIHENDAADELDDAPDSRDDPMANLLKRSLGSPSASPSPGPVATTATAPSAENKLLLKNVQKKIRKRSQGRFFADGWSTSATKISYVSIALMMLLVLALCFFALGPMAVR